MTLDHQRESETESTILEMLKNVDVKIELWVQHIIEQIDSEQNRSEQNRDDYE